MNSQGELGRQGADDMSEFAVVREELHAKQRMTLSQIMCWGADAPMTGSVAATMKRASKPAKPDMSGSKPAKPDMSGGKRGGQSSSPSPRKKAKQ